MTVELADYISEMVRRRPPDCAPVVPGSTPVVAFGDFSRAEVATLGINPSAVEFRYQGKLLDGGERRLATLTSLKAGDLPELTASQVAEVVQDCAAYFRRNPYRRWFDPLNLLLDAGTGTSYYRGSACHLDLVQWATDPVWGRIKESGVRQALLEDGVPHLRAQLRQENIRLVLLNGRTVIRQVQQAGLAQLTEVGVLPLGATTCTLFAGQSEQVRFLGWSANLQSSFGVSKQFRNMLSEWVGKEAGEA